MLMKHDRSETWAGESFSEARIPGEMEALILRCLRTTKRKGQFRRLSRFQAISRMNRHFITGILALFITLSVFGQQNTIFLPFMQKIPTLDGLPDAGPDNMEWLKFPCYEKSDNTNPDITTRYKMGYTLNYLYLIIETESDSIFHRDRAYQNGDGFHLVIARPDSGRASAEFYVLRFSPADESGKIPARKGVWYYNVDLSGRQLSAATRLVCKSADRKSYFEMALPWSEVNPYHPLFSESIGINLCFVKAIGENDKNLYFLKRDKDIQSELSRREYLMAKFEQPSEPDYPVSFASIKNRNMVSGDSINIEIISFSESEYSATYQLSVRSAGDYSYLSVYREKQLIAGANSAVFSLPSEKLSAGGYKLFWRCQDNSEGEIPLSILPEVDYKKEKAMLDSLKSEISAGDYNTMLFSLQNLVKDYKKIKPYETAGSLRERFITYQGTMDSIKVHPRYLSEKPGISRRAFLSAADSTLQPYTIKLPVNFDPGKRYPLFVMLHGSGSDDQGMLDNNLTEHDFIEIAPYGRGTSNCFTADGAVMDVREAIEDAVENYPVNASSIILGGFSMGGYGAYRIYYEYPEMFRGIAVFSGHPGLATRWMGEGHPDFQDTAYLKPFTNTPVFIYHSKNDLNCPYSLTLDLVNKLNDAGAKVVFVTTCEGGHGIIQKEYLPQYYKWLNDVLEN